MAGSLARAQTLSQMYPKVHTSLFEPVDRDAFSMEKGTSLKEAIEQLERRFSVVFLYTSETVKNKKVLRNIRVDDNLEQALKELLAGYSLTFEALNPKTYGLYSTAKEVVQPENEVSGTITDAESGETLPGVNVVIKGTTRGTATNADGQYELNVPSLQDTLIFSFIGYETREVPINGRTEVDVALTLQAIMGEEMVVVGYGVQSRESLTGSVTSVNADDFEDMPSSGQLSNVLAGRLSGVTVTRGAGTPGMESDIQIRAAGTFNNSDPLYVIDGVVSDKMAFDALSTHAVESISILKDGAAASIYGSRAANGVILVTTKRGHEGAPVLSYNGTFGVQTPTRIPETLTAFEHASLINDALNYIGAPGDDVRRYTQDELEYFRNNSFDWIDVLWQNPFSTQHSLSVGGGTDAVRYFLTGSYLYARGSFGDLNYQKANLRGNVDVSITENLTASLDLNTSNRSSLGPSWGGSDWGHEDLYKALALRSRMVPPYMNGRPVGNWVEWHPGVIINGPGYRDTEWGAVNSILTLEYEVPFIEGLSLKAMYNRFKRDEQLKQFNLPYNMQYFQTTGGHGHIVTDEPVPGEEGLRYRDTDEYLAREYENDYSYQFNGYINYRQSFGNHNIDAGLVYEQREEWGIEFYGRRLNFITQSIDQFAAGSSAPEDSQVEGEEEQSARISYIGFANYDYDNTYLLQFSFRYDGSVIFAPEHRWGFFPAVSAGWRISNESFFNSDFINDLKLRASVGLLGNDDVGDFQWLQSYDITDGAIFGSATNGLEPGDLANRAITWEKSLSYNAGIDTRLWNNRIDLTLDLFFRKTFDILGDREEIVPSTFGAGLPDENYQEVHSRGFEVSLGYNSNFATGGSLVSYQIRGHFGYATNEIVRLDEPENIRPHESEIGRPITDDDLFALIATDIIRTQEDLDALPDGYTIDGMEPRLGMLNYKDIRGPVSDEPDGRITDADRVWLTDYSEPPMSFGLSLGGSWKSFSLNVLFQGVAGHKIMLHSNARRVQDRVEEASYGFWADHWTPQNTDASMPFYTETIGWPPTDFPASSWFMRDASFIRLKNLNLSYVLPQEITSGLAVNDIRLFFTATNLALLYDNIEYYDPEVENIRAYPMMKTFSFGLNVNL